MKSRHVAVILALLAAQAPLSALEPSLKLTQYVHESWTTNDGLPQDSVNDIAQTPDGYLWVATQEGIARFDGMTFRTFDSRTSGGRIGNFVYTLLVDRNGTLWAGSGASLLRYNGSGFDVYGRERGLPGTTPGFLHEDTAGNLWLGFGSGGLTGGDGLARYRDGKTQRFTMKDGLPSDQVHQTWSDSSGALWIATAEGLSVLRGGRFTNYTTADGLPDKYVRTLLIDRKGDVWIGTHRGLARLSHGRFTTFGTSDGLPNESINALYEDRDGAIWIATERGLARIVHGAIEPASRAMIGLADERIFSFFEDREGSLWIGTHSGGLHRLRAGKFTPWGPPEGLLGESVSALYEDSEGRIWIGASNGSLNVLDGRTLTTYTPEARGTTSPVKTLLEDGARSYLLGTTNGLQHFKDGRFTSVSTEGLPDSSVNVLHRDRRGTTWVGTGRGLARFVGGRLEHFPLPAKAPASIRLLHEDRSGRFWIGGGDGLGYLENGRYEPVLAIDEHRHFNTQAVHEDPDGTLWVTTWGDGLFRVNGRRVTRISYENGLFDDSSWSIVDDGIGNFWMSSNRGVFRVSRHQLDRFANGQGGTITPVVYGTADGMRRRETNLMQRSVLRTRDGHLWFATTAGAVSIDPKNIRTNPLPPTVVIDSIRIDEKPVPLTSEIVVPAGARRIVILYSALSLIAPTKVHYRYQLEGFDEDWIDVETRRSAWFTNLDPGTYTFRVIAANNDGVWNEQGATISFRLRRFFYQTWWFYALVTIAAVLLVLLVERLRRRQREIRHQVYHDPLTGLPNRRLLTERAEVALQQATQKNHSIAILFFDLDGFKGVNDSLGHAAGDRLLQLVASRFLGCIRDIDTLARIGGDEFALLAADLTDEMQAAVLAQRIIDAMRKQFSFDGHHATLGVSIGIAIHPFDGTEVKTLLQAADRAMYRAKLAGGNAWQFNAAEFSELVTL